MNYKVSKKQFIFYFFFFLSGITYAREFNESSFLIVHLQDNNLNDQQLWNFLGTNDHSGVEIEVTEKEGQFLVAGHQTVDFLIAQIQTILESNRSKILPVFVHFQGNFTILDSLIRESPIASQIFYLPRGEAWPTYEDLMHSNRRLLFFVDGEVDHAGQTFHQADDYFLRISATSGLIGGKNSINRELFMIDDFEKLPIQFTAERNIRNLVPDYTNFLLESWTKYGKRPNFIFVGNDIFQFDFIISQLSSFIWISGTVRGSGKNIDKVYWRNPDILVTGGRFSFPYLGGQELTLTPFVPGYRMIPEQIIVTGEMEVPEDYHLMAHPLNLGDQLTGSFHFENSIVNSLSPAQLFPGENFTFNQDIERGTVLRLPENASVNLGSPDIYGLRNSSFSVSCFVKFSEILQHGDNAVIGNYESEYRRGLHLILRSGHPYFGLWANDYISEEKLEPNIWYHMVWRYILETGEQAIFINGRNIGSSTGHPPFSGSGDIFLGSALLQGASLRGYIDNLNFWSRALGAEEISKLALDEEVTLTGMPITPRFFQRIDVKLALMVLFSIIVMALFSLMIRKRRRISKVKLPVLPEKTSANQLLLFGRFTAINRFGNDISILFTPKIKELFLYVLLSTIKNGTGAAVSEIDETLWSGLPPQKVTNNRAVTLNKLRKILQDVEGLEILTLNGFLQAKMDNPFFCDFVEAYKLCHVSGGMNRAQLETFFLLVQRGRFLKELNLPWLDEIRGYTGNQMIDNLLKLAVFYRNEKNLEKIDAIARRILEYDDLNEEAVWLQVWSLNQSDNNHQARFQFNSFCSKYTDTLSESYPMNFEQFCRNFERMF
ncbi:MAG: LamG-like jellyroll fold domain-containing protein [Mariniphaga sp.]|nr:hypothetical protein [Mariniphaga sp.]MDD4225396.1 hypothetical protein [Mariniphaga sp.]MDD4425863.1 hypothetical protein [Mariniphaga sp.]